MTGRDAAAELGRPRAAAPPTSSPPRACSRRCCARCAIDWRVEPGGERAVPAPAPRGHRATSGDRRAGWLGELHPSVAAAWDLDGVAGFELDFGALAAAATGVPRYEDLTSFPAIRQDIAVVVGDDVPAARVLELIRAAGGALLRERRGLRRLPRRAGRRGPRLARRAARVPRARPHAHRRGGRAAAREDRRRAARPGRGRAAWLGSRVLGASGYAGAIAAMLVHHHPFFELAHVTARSEAGARLDDIHPRTRVPMELESWDPDRAVRRRRRAGVLAAPRRRARGRRAARARRAGRRPLRRLPAQRPRDLRGLVRRARRARRCSARASTGCPSCTATTIAGADLVANPGCYPTAALLALAPLARAGLIGDVVIDAKSGVSGAGREPTRHHALHLGRREHDAVQGRAPPPHARRSSRSSRARARRSPSRSRRTSSRSRRASWSPATSRPRATTRRTRSWASTTTRTRASRGSSCGSARPACSRCARRTTAGSRSTATAAPGGSSCSRRSTTCGRAPPRRPCRTST